MNNLKPDYGAQYPTAEEQNVFLTTYVCENSPELAKQLDMNGEWDDFLSVMRKEVGKHSLISHLGWACWSILQNSSSSIEFDYVTYGKLRLQGYRFFKKQFWPHLKFNPSQRQS